MKNAIIYARISRQEEERNDGGYSESLLNQLEILRNYANEKGYKIVAEYLDDGVSGEDFDRKGLNSLIESCKSQKIDYVLVKDLSRLGRVARKVCNLVEEVLLGFGVKVIAITDDFEGENCQFDNFFTIKNCVNEYYLKDYKSKLKAVKDFKAHNTHLNFYPKYGYNFNENGEEIIDEYSSKIVKEIFSLAKNGLSCSEISRVLNENGIKSRSFYASEVLKLKPLKNKLHEKWSYHAVREIILDEEYLGHSINHARKPKNERIFLKNTHLAIISEEDFLLAQKVIKRQKNRSKPVILVDELTGKRLLFEEKGDYSNYFLRLNGKRKYTINKRKLELLIKRCLVKKLNKIFKSGEEVCNFLRENLKEIIGVLKEQKFEKERCLLKITDMYLQGRFVSVDYEKESFELLTKIKEIEEEIILEEEKFSQKTTKIKSSLNQNLLEEVADILVEKMKKIIVNSDKFIIKTTFDFTNL